MFVHPLLDIVDMDKSTRSFEMMSAILVLLAGGYMAAYFPFDHSKVGVRRRTTGIIVLSAPPIC